MADDTFTLVVFSIIFWIIFLVVFFIVSEKITSRRNRVILPIISVIVIVLIGSLFASMINGEIPALILSIPIPTLAIFTVLPFLPLQANVRTKGIIVGFVSLVCSLLFFYYIWGSNFGGIRMIFLSFSLTFKSNDPFAVIALLITSYAELIALAGFVLGGAFLVSSVSSFIHDPVWESVRFPASLTISVLLAGFLYFVANSFLPGFLAIFIFIVLRGIPSKIIRVLLPAGIAVLSSLVLSLCAEYRYDFSLFAFGLVALAAVTLFPAFESFLRKDEHEISIFLDSALVAIILSTVVYGMNATDIVDNVLNSLKSLTTGGAFVIGVPLAESLIPKLAFYGYGIIISVVGYGAIILIGRLRKKIESKQPRHEGEDGD